MKYLFRKIAIIALIVTASQIPAHALSSSALHRAPVPTLVEKYLRTELFMGMSKPSGGVVSDAEWERFLDEVVTPAFPKGYTVLRGDGRYRGDGNRTISEKSVVLVILYPKKERKDSRRKIDEIRAAYIRQFEQDAVIRMDLNSVVDVSFK